MYRSLSLALSMFAGMGRLTGVMDDRGKFIYVSQEEMAAVADYIKVCFNSS